MVTQQTQQTILELCKTFGYALYMAKGNQIIISNIEAKMMLDSLNRILADVTSPVMVGGGVPTSPPPAPTTGGGT